MNETELNTIKNYLRNNTMTFDEAMDRLVKGRRTTDHSKQSLFPMDQKTCHVQRMLDVRVRSSNTTS